MGFTCAVTHKHVQGKPVKVTILVHEEWEHPARHIEREGNKIISAPNVYYRGHEKVCMPDYGGVGRQIKKEVMVDPEVAHNFKKYGVKVPPPPPAKRKTVKLRNNDIQFYVEKYERLAADWERFRERRKE